MTYTRYTASRRLGPCTLGRPHEAGDDEAGWSFAHPGRVPANTVGLAAPWNALPRLPKRDDPRDPVLRRWARAVLVGRGIQAPARITAAYSIDLDGDGTPECVFSAWSPNQDTPQVPRKAQYSFLAVRTHGVTVVLNGGFDPTPHSYEEYLDHYTPVAFLDIDGDGTPEILAEDAGWEWGGIQAYHVTPTGATLLLSCYEGGN